MGNIQHNPVKLETIDFKQSVNNELDANREMYALFLVHGYTEAYLRDILYYIGQTKKEKKANKVTEEFDRIGFKSLLTLHAILGTFDDEPQLYSKLEVLNKARNEIAHNMISIEHNNEKTKKEIKGIVKSGLDSCEKVYQKYKGALEKRAKSMGSVSTP
ncbi:MAG: hypothetical protein V1728_06520 [Candidatus Micrarchaeota archaeon]